MSRILKELREYDDSVTVGQLISKLEQEEISAKQIETEKINKVKEDFKDIYLKRIYDCDLFGEILQVFHIEEIVDTGKDTSYETFYYFKGSKISFEYNGINFQEIDGDDVYHSFSEEDLRQMTPLTKEEYEYYKSKFESIREQLKNINNYENI